jgi:menaquinone-dependent protoporphyrinogen oxidase
VRPAPVDSTAWDEKDGMEKRVKCDLTQKETTMSNSILVAYATRYGSTHQAAETIAATLRECGLETDLLPAAQVQSLEDYHAVVLGAPLQIGRWHGDAHRFLGRFRHDLTELPVAVYALGPLHRDESEIQSAREQFDRELAKYTWLTPIEIKVFVGRFDPAQLHFPASLFLRQIPPSDEMDLEAIRDWAVGLAATLKPEALEAAPVLAVA